MLLAGAVGALSVAALALGAEERDGARTAAPRGTIVYVCGVDLCSLERDGADRRRLTRDGTRSAPYASPSLSRDGRTQSFVRGGRVWVAGRGASGARRLPARPRGDDRAAPRAQRVRVSPDGSSLLAFERRFLNGDVGSPTETYVAGTDGATLAARPLLSASAAWGPEGELMDFGWSSRGASLICLRPAGGDDLRCPRVLARGDLERDLRQPSLSPDGRTLAVVRYDGREASGTSSEIVLFDIGTGRPTRALGTVVDARDPTWSPDGRSIVLSAARLESARPGVRVYRGRSLFVVRADGSGSPRLIARDGDQPAWGF